MARKKNPTRTTDVKKRKGPAVSANSVSAGKRMRGNDGKMWTSKRMPQGHNRWIRGAESQVTWEDMQGQSSPSSPPDGIFMADQVDEIYGTGHIIGQTGSTWTTSPLAAEDEYASGYGENSAWPSSQGVPVWYVSAETFCADCGEYEAECGCYAGESFDVPVVGTVGTKSAVFGIGLGVGLMALLARFKK